MSYTITPIPITYPCPKCGWAPELPTDERWHIFHCECGQDFSTISFKKSRFEELERLGLRLGPELDPFKNL